MSPLPHTVLAEDGKPPVDIVELATAILQGGLRRETMVSMREVRAMALAISDFNIALSQAALVIHLIGRFDEESPAGERKRLVDNITVLSLLLTKLGFLEEPNAQTA